MLNLEDYDSDLLKGEDSEFLKVVNKIVKSKKHTDSKVMITAFIIKRLLESCGFITGINSTKLLEEYKTFFNSNISDRTVRAGKEILESKGYITSEDETKTTYMLIVTSKLCEVLAKNGIGFIFRITELDRILRNKGTKDKKGNDFDLVGRLISFRASAMNRHTGALSSDTPIRLSNGGYVKMSEIGGIHQKRKEYRKEKESIVHEHKTYDPSDFMDLMRISSTPKLTEEQQAELDRRLEEARLAKEENIATALNYARLIGDKVGSPGELKYGLTIDESQREYKDPKKIIKESEESYRRGIEKALYEKSLEDNSDIEYIDTDYEDE